MIQAYFFDLDGTLLDTEILWVEAVEMLAGAHGHELTREQALKMVYGISWPEIHEDLTRRFPDMQMGLDDMGALLAPHFLELRAQRDVRIESSITLLRRLAKTHPVAVVSGSYRVDVEAAIEIMDVGEILAFYLGHEDYHPGKPHPACYLRAAELAQAAPERCVVFEDSNAGICAAKDAGMIGVALARPERPAQDHSRADLVLADLAAFTPEQVMPT